MDMEKVISRLDNLRRFADTEIHPIISPDNWVVYSILCDLIDFTKADILSMLKEQEAKPVIESTNMYTGLPITHCPKCGKSLDRYLYGRQQEGEINFCPYCGQAVKWE